MTSAALLTAIQDGFSGKEGNTVPQAVLDYLRALIREGLEMDADEPVPADRPIGQLGVDSLLSLELGDRIGEDLGVFLGTDVIADQPTLAEIAALLVAELRTRAA